MFIYTVFFFPVLIAYLTEYTRILVFVCVYVYGDAVHIIAPCAAMCLCVCCIGSLFSCCFPTHKTQWSIYTLHGVCLCDA